MTVRRKLPWCFTHNCSFEAVEPCIVNGHKLHPASRCPACVAEARAKLDKALDCYRHGLKRRTQVPVVVVEPVP